MAMTKACSRLSSSSYASCARQLVRASPHLVPVEHIKQKTSHRRWRCTVQAISPAADRASHNQVQSTTFGRADIVSQFTVPLPAEIDQRLKVIVDAVPSLGPSSRVVDVGSGTGCLIPHIRARGVQDILAVDLSDAMLQQLRQRYTSVGGLGNELGVRTWLGDIVDLPNYMGPADTVFFNAVFGNLHSPRDGLLRAALLLRPGGHLVISHPMGRAWHSSLHAEQPALVPHQLPSKEELQALIADMPLNLLEMRDEEGLYLAVLQVPPRYALPKGPVFLSGPVVHGFGRGSRQMGTPTANIDPEPLKEQLAALPKGVYFGWARLDVPDSWPAADRAVHKMVMNIGRRPTASADDPAAAVTVEAHLLHSFSRDFYGEKLRVLALGYVRPEMRFPGGLPQLITRIKADVATSRVLLDEAPLVPYKEDARLQ